MNLNRLISVLRYNKLTMLHSVSPSLARYISYKLEIHRLKKETKQYNNRIFKFLNTLETGSKGYDDVSYGIDYNNQQMREKIKEIKFEELYAKASRIGVDPVLLNGIYQDIHKVVGEFSDTEWPVTVRVIDEEVLYKLKSLIRVELKAENEIMALRFSLLTGLIGSITGLIGVIIAYYSMN